MKIKIIKRAELEAHTNSHAAEPQPKRRRITREVKRWVAEIRERTDAESRISFDALFANHDNRQLG